jgi:spore maturation protein CgeB
MSHGISMFNSEIRPAQASAPVVNKYSIVFIGLSITSSWGNGHATTYRSLIKGLASQGVNVLFLEQDAPWYAPHRDLTAFPFARIHIYGSLQELKNGYGDDIRHADLVIVGSYVQHGTEVIDWVLETADGAKAFYDIDTPITYTALTRGEAAYLKRAQIPRFDMYLSFTGGPLLEQLEQEFGAHHAQPLYCSVDETLYFPQEGVEKVWKAGYLGTYSQDRQESLEEFLLRPAQTLSQHSFVVAGPQYPQEIVWPANVERIDHIPPEAHCRFYNQQRLTLNITRKDMITWGYSPSVRLFEAAASGTCIMSDYWQGLEDFFLPDKELLVGRKTKDVLSYLNELTDEDLAHIRSRAVKRVLKEHTGQKRAQELLRHVHQFSSIFSVSE